MKEGTGMRDEQHRREGDAQERERGVERLNHNCAWELPKTNWELIPVVDSISSCTGVVYTQGYTYMYTYMYIHVYMHSAYIVYTDVYMYYIPFNLFLHVNVRVSYM